MDSRTLSTFARGITSPHGVMCGLLRAALLASTALTTNVYSAPARAQDATWLGTPINGIYNDGTNWSTGAPPTGTAVFGASTVNSLEFTSNATVGGWTFNAGASNYDFKIAAGFALTFRGAGIVIDGGGATITNDGTLYFFDSSTAGSAAITNNPSGTVDFSNSTGPNNDRKISAGSIAGAGNYILGANELTVGSNDLSTEVSGVISGAGGALVKTGTGTLTLSGVNTYTGGTMISAGTLQLGNGGATGSISGNVVNDGVLAFNRNDVATFSGAISGSGAVQQIGSGTTILTGANSYSGGTRVSSGTLQLGNGGATGAISGNVVNNGVLAFNRTGTLTLAGAISGSGAVQQIGLGTTILTGANTYTGGTLINRGTLQLGNATNAGAIAGVVNVGPTGSFSVVNADTSGITAIMNLGFTDFRNSTSAGSATIASTRGLIFRDSTSAGSAAIDNMRGELSFSDSSTAGSATITNYDDLSFYGSSTAASAAITNNTSVSFYSNSTAGSAAITNKYAQSTVHFFTTGPNGDGKISAGSIAGYGRYILDANELTVGSNNLSTQVSGVISGAGGALVKTGTGTLTLSGVNSYTGGTTINGGTLQLGNATDAGAIAGAVTVGSSGRFNVVNADTSGITRISNSGSTSFRNSTSAGNAAITNNASGSVDFSGTNGPNGDGKISAGSIAGAGSYILGANELTVGSNNLSTEVSGVISGAGGSLVKTGTGTLTLSGVSSYADGTTISAGTLQLGNGGATGAISGNVVNNGVLAFNRTGTLSLAGDFSGSGAVQQIGAGTTILTGTNTYTGDTTVSGGRLQFGEGSAGGSNNLGGNLRVTGGTLAIQTPATLNVAQTVTFGDNTALSIVAGVNSPALSANSVAIGNGVVFNISGIDSASQLDKVLINTTSGISGDFASITVGGVSTVDYLTVSTRKSADSLQYLASYGLSWFAGNNLAHGTFTLTDASDTFTVGTSLADQAANPATGWNGTSLTKVGAGTLILTGDNTYSGGTTISAGTLQLGNGGATGSISGNVVNDGVLAFNRSDVMTFAGAISGNGAVRQIGSGTTILTGDNSYNGGSLLQNGVLSVSRDSNLGAVSAALMFDGGTLQVTGTSFTSTARTINWGMGGGGFDIADASNAFTLSQALSGSGSLGKFGAGTLILTADNTYTCGTTINSGTLQLGNATNAGAIVGAVTVGSSGTLDVVNADASGITHISNSGSTYFHNSTSAGSAAIANNYDLYFYNNSTAGSAAITNNSGLYFYNTSTAGSAAITNNASGTVDFSRTTGPNNDRKLSAGSIAGAGSYVLGANELTVGSNGLSTEVSGVIAGAGGSLVKTGTGTLILSGDNTYSGGTTINGGALQLGNGGATGAILGDVVNSGVLAFNRSDVVTFSSTISGTGAVQQIGAGMTILTGANSYSGGTTISGGTLQLGNGGATGAISGNVVNNGVLAFNRTGTLSLAGNISGSGAVQQIGAGTTILTGTNTYTGDTTVSDGRLQFGDGSAGGSNNLGGNLRVTGGALAIQTPATLNVAQTATFGDNTALSIVAGTNSPALSADRVAIGNGVAFNISGINSASQLDKVMIDTRSGISGDFASITVGGFGGTADYLTVSTRKSADSLQYLASYGLSWFAGNNLAHGTFTLTDASDTFTVGTSLADQAANPATGWNGTSLTKVGAGTLIVTGDNTYTGGTTISAGTLQLGNGGAAGSISGNVVNDGVLAFNRSDVATFADAISGNGAVRQIGSGTTILTGTNSYSGGTTISGGTLQLGNGGGTGSISGNVVNAGALAFNRDDAITFAGDISGNGAVQQMGAGATILTGDNSYSGGTTISGGTLQLGNGGATGSILGDLVNDGVLAFNRSDVATFVGAISGTGAVQQIGVGTTILTGGNTYSGGTMISSGTLQLGNGGATGAIVGKVVNDGVLAFNRTGTLSLAGDISGSGAVQQIGAGTTILTGSNSYDGDTLVSSGRLQFGDGSAGDTNTLGGNLTVTGGTLAIQTPATLNVAQNVTLADRTTLSIVAGNGPALSADLVAIGNNVAINIGGVNDASQLDKVLINTTSGISGDFATVSVGGSSGAVDYLTVSIRKSADSLQYLASYGLSWALGNNLANGTFTLTDAADSFTVGAALADQAANPATGWDGTSLTKAGAGTLILAGDNTYSGGTTISGGVLSVSRDANLGAATGGLTFTGGTLSTTASFDTARSVSLTQAGRFDVAAGTELGLTGVVSGSGDLVKSGDGTLRLDNGANSYANTLVVAGTLIGNAGSISGNIGNGGTVFFDQTGNAIFAGDIGGLNGTSGVMVKRGAGALTLAGLSSLDWTVEAGGLVAAAERFGGDAAIASGATLTFDQSANATYAGALSGAGTFNKTGAGLLGLTGDSSGFTGTTTVAGGTLTVNGALGGALNVLAAGRLQGSGTVGNSIVSGTIAPGNSIGTLHVAGDITFNPGSIYEAEVNAAGQSDKIIASGTATINGGSIKVLAGAGNYAPQTQYTILTANAPSGRSGTFDGVNSNLAFLDPSLSYDANNVYLTMTRNSIDFKGVGITLNQIATGGGVESLGFVNPVYNAALNLSAPQARYAFDQLSGEIHASAKTALIEDSRFIRNAVNDRIRAAFDAVGASGIVTTYVDGKPIMVKPNTDRLAVWGQGFGSWGHTNGDGNAARLNRSTGGFFIGADATVFDTWRFGTVAGYSSTSFDVKDRHSPGASDNYHVGLYGGTAWGDLAFRTGAAYTWHDISTSRNVIFPGFGDSLKGRYDAATTQVFGELGYGFNASGARFEPFANLAYVNLHTDGFAELGGAAALTGTSANTDVTFTTLGLRASTALDFGGASVTAKAMLGWRHAFGPVMPLSTMRFASGGDAFSIGGVPITRDAAVIEAGLDYAITPNALLGVSYGGQFGSDLSDQSARFNLNVKF